MEKRIEVATVVYYDGTSAYTTHRALRTEGDSHKLTKESKRALDKDMEEAGMRLLLVDFENAIYSYNSGVDFMNNFKKPNWWDEVPYNEEKYVKDMFIEYYCG